MPWKKRSLYIVQEQKYLGKVAKENSVPEGPGIDQLGNTELHMNYYYVKLSHSVSIHPREKCLQVFFQVFI